MTPVMIVAMNNFQNHFIKSPAIPEIASQVHGSGAESKGRKGETGPYFLVKSQCPKVLKKPFKIPIKTSRGFLVESKHKKPFQFSEKNRQIFSSNRDATNQKIKTSPTNEIAKP